MSVNNAADDCAPLIGLCLLEYFIEHEYTTTTNLNQLILFGTNDEAQPMTAGVPRYTIPLSKLDLPQSSFQRLKKTVKRNRKASHLQGVLIEQHHDTFAFEFCYRVLSSIPAIEQTCLP